MIPSSPLISANNTPTPSSSVSKPEKLKNESKIDNPNIQQKKEQNKVDVNKKNDDNKMSSSSISSDNINNSNNNKSRSLSASYDFKKSITHNTTNKYDDVSAVRKYSGHTYVRTSFDTGGNGEAPYSSSTYTASASPVQSVGRYSLENLEIQGPFSLSITVTIFRYCSLGSQSYEDF